METGSRHLKDITDDELAQLVNISRQYAAKEFWGEPKITRIKRRQFTTTFVIYYEQERLSDGLKSERRMFLDWADLSYFVAEDAPYERQTPSFSVCSDTQMFLWLITQGFDVLECLKYAPVVPNPDMTSCVEGYAVIDGYPEDGSASRVFARYEKEEAEAYAAENPQRRLYVIMKPE